VLAVRNGERTIRACVDSLLALEHPSFELVVVDNRSTDRTRELLAGYGEAIRIVEEPTRGAGAARNAGVRAARGGTIAFTDGDCIADPSWLAELVAGLEDGVGVAGGEVRARPGAGRLERFGELIHDQRSSIVVDRPPAVSTSSWASPRGVLEEVGLFDVGFLRGQDSDLSYRIGAAGYRIVYRPGAVVYHLGNERTLAGLLREGWLHGFWNEAVNRRHRAYLERQPAGRGRPRQRGLPAAAFRLGKRSGRAAARLWLRLAG
jgi:GT2 family glycosyltransferase